MGTVERIRGRVVEDPTGCWVWTGARTDRGYGRIHVRNDPAFGGLSTTSVHRATYVLLKGQVPSGMDLDHLCRNRACCNPDHLEPVDRLTNVRRGAGNGGVLAPERVSCERGHSSGPGRCKDCARAAHRVRAVNTRASGLTPPSHGVSGYTNYGCRCDECRTAMREYRRRNRTESAA